MGRAKIYVPRSGNLEEVRATGLSDELAMSYGTLFARMLSEQDGYVLVTLESDSVRLIGHNTDDGILTFGRLRPYREEKER